jgi:hypothetical protein
MCSRKSVPVRSYFDSEPKPAPFPFIAPMLPFGEAQGQPKKTTIHQPRGRGVLRSWHTGSCIHRPPEARGWLLWVRGGLRRKEKRGGTISASRGQPEPTSYLTSCNLRCHIRHSCPTKVIACSTPIPSLRSPMYFSANAPELGSPESSSTASSSVEGAGTSSTFLVFGLLGGKLR